MGLQCSWFVVLLTLTHSLRLVVLECNVHVTRETCLTRHKGIREDCGWSPDRRCYDVKRQRSVEDKRKRITACKGVSAYDPLLAYNYTLMSALAYSESPKACQSKILRDNDFVLQQGISSPCKDLKLPLFNYNQCFAYTAVSNKSKTVLVAYRGTVFPKNSSLSKQIIDEILSVLVFPKTPFLIGGKVEHYFKNAHEKLSPCVEKSIRSLTARYPGYHVTITGHSLGAALASLSAASLVYKGLVKNESLSVYNFGEPRVGDGVYATAYDRLVSNSWRVVHSRDIVAHLPMCKPETGCSVSNGWSYHTKTEVFYSAIRMNVTSPYKICAGNEDAGCSDGAISKNLCLWDYRKCIEYHKAYFGIQVGTLCDKSLGSRKRFLKGEGRQEKGRHGSRISKGQGYARERGMPDSCKIIDL